MVIILENFQTPEFDPRLEWHAPPHHWRIEPALGQLVVVPDPATDFWQNTHYGFQADNGHFLSLVVSGNARMTVTVSMAPMHQYDQAGAMIRYSPDCWIKTAVEYEENGPSKLGVVVTNHGFSDWSTQNFQEVDQLMSFRIERRGYDYLVSFAQSTTPQSWNQLRIAHLTHPPHVPIRYGLYTCCPQLSGLQTRFNNLIIESGEEWNESIR